MGLTRQKFSRMLHHFNGLNKTTSVSTAPELSQFMSTLTTDFVTSQTGRLVRLT